MSTITCLLPVLAMILYARVATYVNCHMYVTCLGHDPVCEGGHAANVLVVHHLQQATLPPAEYIKAQLRH